jgi:hypothetical protein
VSVKKTDTGDDETEDEIYHSQIFIPAPNNGPTTQHDNDRRDEDIKESEFVQGGYLNDEDYDESEHEGDTKW